MLDTADLSEPLSNVFKPGEGGLVSVMCLFPSDTWDLVSIAGPLSLDGLSFANYLPFPLSNLANFSLLPVSLIETVPLSEI